MSDTHCYIALEICLKF